MEDTWYCEACKRRGEVLVEVGEDIGSFVNKIDTDHQRSSPQCSTDYRGLRILNVHRVTVEKIKEVMSFLRVAK